MSPRRQEAPERARLLKELLEWLGLLGFLYGPLDRRLSLRSSLEQGLRRPVYSRIPWWGCFGGIAFFLFLIQLVTGVLLTLFYVPVAAEAFHSIRDINNQVPFGWLLRSCHHWAGNGMLFALFIHVLRVFVTGAYRPPRDLNWLVGICLLLLTVAFVLTGTLLPWSQSAYWNTVAWTDLASRIPLLGHPAMLMLRGGDDVSGITLLRFYSLHVSLLPMLTALFMLLHFFIVRRQGISEPL